VRGDKRLTEEEVLDRFNSGLAATLGFIAIVALAIAGGMGLIQSIVTQSYVAKVQLERSGYTPDEASLFRAVSSQDVRVLGNFKTLKVNLIARNAEGLSPLSLAAKNGWAESVKELTRLGVKPGSEPKSPLAWAMEGGHRAIAVFLLEHGYTPELKGAPDGVRAPVCLALEDKDLDLVKLMLEKGANPNQDMAPGLPALHWTIQQEWPEAWKLLLQRGADIDTASKDGLPIYQAVRRGDEDLLRNLLARGAGPNSTSPDGTPLTVAALNLKQAALARLLIEEKADVNRRRPPDGLSVLQTAFTLRDLETFQLALAQGGDLKFPFANGQTLLERAVQDNDLEWTKRFLALGCDANQPSAAGLPLWWDQYQKKNIVMAETLLASGADINAKGADGLSPIERAIEERNPRAVRYFFAKGATAKGHLWNALEERNHAVLRHLLARGENPNSPSSISLSPLAYAITNGDYTGAALLMEYGAKVEVDDKPSGHSLLEWAVATRQQWLVECLVNRGMDPNQKVKSPASEEFLAKFDSGNLKYFLANDRGLTPLMLVAGSGQHRMAQFLISKGAKRNVNTDKKGTWPISFATSRSDVPMQQIMMGRDPFSPEGNPRKIVVDVGQQRAKLLKDGEVVLSSSCSTGKSGYSTPRGTFVITEKTRSRVSNLYDAEMPYFLRLSGSAVGMHQGIVPGYPASHGCIRLPAGYASKFWNLAQLGDIIEVK